MKAPRCPGCNRLVHLTKKGTFYRHKEIVVDLAARRSSGLPMTCAAGLGDVCEMSGKVVTSAIR